MTDTEESVMAAAEATGPGVRGGERVVRCLLVFGQEAEFVLEDAETDDPVRWPAAVVAGETGLDVARLPGRRFGVQVSEDAGRVCFSGFRVLPG